MHSKSQKLSSFFSEAGFDYKTMEVGRFYPLNEKWEILSRNSEGDVWKRVTHLVRKEASVPIIVQYMDTQLLVSPEHKFFARVSGSDGWIEALDLIEESSIFLLHQSFGWIPAYMSAGTEEIEILDMTVEDTESYYSNGVLSHNTMYGDPTTTPGGAAIPFHASVRIKLGAGQHILNKDKEPIGINVSAKTIKNKMAAPFRTCDFEIHFGVGIKEHEQIFDVLRKHGPEVIDGKKVEIHGAGAWKNLTVSSEATGDVFIDKKFYKSDFNEIMTDPLYANYIDDLLERVMMRKCSTDTADIDAESYEEVRAISMEVGGIDGLDISPED